MSTTIRIMLDQRDGTTVELGRIGSKDGKKTYSSCASLVEYPEVRYAITLSLLRWIEKMQKFGLNQDQKEESE